MGFEWGNTYGAHMAKLYGTDMYKHNESYIVYLDRPKVVIS